SLGGETGRMAPGFEHVRDLRRRDAAPGASVFHPPPAGLGLRPLPALESLGARPGIARACGRHAANVAAEAALAIVGPAHRSRPAAVPGAAAGGTPGAEAGHGSGAGGDVEIC